ncbi:MAG: redoxin domain-containing protein [Nitrospirae bacterium]|nr:redoxin domain-containing protein [Nitrospirota bacterium]
MEKLYKEFGGRVEFIGMNQGDKEKIGPFRKKYGLSFPNAHDDNRKILSAFKARVPTHVLIGIHGTVQYMAPHMPGRKELEKLLGKD